MNTFLDPTTEYRTEFINVLKSNNRHYDSILSKYSTPSKKYNIDYYKWTHPYQGDWEKREIFTDEILDSLKTIIGTDGIVIDVGAQVGLMSIGFAQFAKKVISFEPNPAAFEVLDRNTEIYKNIQPYNLACSTEEGVFEFHYSDEGFCNGGFASHCSKGIGVTGHIIPMDVYGVNLSDFLKSYHANDIKNITLIKIDAEGFDKEILKTISPILLEIKPTIITEMYSGLVEGEAMDLISTIQNLSYEIYDIGNANEGLISITTQPKINSIKDVKLGSHGNFLCVPKK